jgi:hypothetical protein
MKFVGRIMMFTDKVCVIIEHQAAAAVSRTNNAGSNSDGKKCCVVNCTNNSIRRQRGVIRKTNKQTNIC